ncbi:MAG: flotillin domain-containing protein [Promethearchaeota archaeon]
MISDQLLNLTKDWGIIIESLEIVEAQVLDNDLKNNMEAVKKIQQQQSARMADANAKQIYRLREIDVSRQADLAEKDKAIQVQQQEMTRMEIEAESYRKAKLIKANADAEAIKMIKLAEKQAEAEGIRLKMEAEAEGFQKQVEAINAADDNFLSIKLIEKLPEVYQNISPEKMIVMGEGNQAFNSILTSVLPLLEILPKFKEQFNQGNVNKERSKKKAVKNKKKTERIVENYPEIPELTKKRK